MKNDVLETCNAFECDGSPGAGTCFFDADSAARRNGLKGARTAEQIERRVLFAHAVAIAGAGRWGFGS
jgi:hypothetical protein